MSKTGRHPTPGPSLDSLNMDLTAEPFVRMLFQRMAGEFVEQVNTAMSAVDFEAADSEQRVQEALQSAVSEIMACFDSFAWGFAGQAPEGVFKIDPDWHGPSLGRHLKNHLAVELMELPREMRDRIEADEDYVPLSMALFVRELVGAMWKSMFEMAESPNPEDHDPVGACMVVADRWAALFIKPAGA